MKELGKVLVAFSGGVDSTYLLYLAKKELGAENVLAAIAQSPTYPAEELKDAKKIAEEMGIKYRVIKTDEFRDENFLSNPKERCYHCKKELFLKLKALAKENGIATVVDGSNQDDLSDLRPGALAKKELGIRSPLEEAGLTKAAIRKLSRQAGLPTWDKPSQACLASRIPYGTRITENILKMVSAGEQFLKTLGFKKLRVRHHGGIARIEVDRDSALTIMAQELMDKIVRKFEEIGYTYVTLDLKGYRTGSLNEEILT